MDQVYNQKYLKIDPKTRKMWRLLIAEKYVTEKVGDKMWNVTTKDAGLKAYINDLGFQICANSDDYDIVDVHKMHNLCMFIQSQLINQYDNYIYTRLRRSS